MQQRITAPSNIKNSAADGSFRVLDVVSLVGGCSADRVSMAEE